MFETSKEQCHLPGLTIRVAISERSGRIRFLLPPVSPKMLLKPLFDSGSSRPPLVANCRLRRAMYSKLTPLYSHSTIRSTRAVPSAPLACSIRASSPGTCRTPGRTGWCAAVRACGLVEGCAREPVSSSAGCCTGSCSSEGAEGRLGTTPPTSGLLATTHPEREGKACASDQFQLSTRVTC